MGKDEQVDLLLLTGDLSDHAVNADPTHQVHQDIDTPQKLWDALDGDRHTDRERYPRFIDALKALSLLHDFMDTHEKPVCFVDGNHEAYEIPYGISPRVAILGVRANAGIPADQGLTIYEAVLLYGPDYNNVGSASNFTGPNLAWVHHLLTPWRDWALSYGEAQTFIGLGWGEGENYLYSKIAGGGTLPRAAQSCTDEQLALVQDAVDGRGAKQNLLLSHFAYVNYATDVPFDAPGGRVDIDDVTFLDGGSGDRSSWDQGSFHSNREVLYEQYLRPGRVHYTFSGHSHRAGAYALTGDANWVHEMPTRGNYPHGHIHSEAGACLLVTGAGGPFSWQNREGEYLGMGLEPPQGLKLDAAAGKVEIVRDTQSRPPIAVVLDYLWYEKKLPALKFPLLGDENGFKLYLTNAWNQASVHGGEMLHEIRLHLHTGGERGYQGFLQLIQTGCKRVRISFNNYYLVSFEVDTDMGDLSLLKFRQSLKDGEGDPIYFLSIHLKQIKHGTLHDHYDYDSPWCFPAEMKMGKRWSIRRVSGRDGGELPDFKGVIFPSTKLGDIYGV